MNGEICNPACCYWNWWNTHHPRLLLGKSRSYAMNKILHVSCEVGLWYLVPRGITFPKSLGDTRLDVYWNGYAILNGGGGCIHVGFYIIATG